MLSTVDKMCCFPSVLYKLAFTLHYIKDVLCSSPSVNRKLLKHILTNVPTHLPHTQTSELDDYNKLSLKSHVALHFDHLDLKNAMVPFTIPLA